MPELKYEYITRADRLPAIAQECFESEVVALDLETTPKPEWVNLPMAALSPHTGRARLCSLNTGKHCYVIDLFQTGGLGPLRDVLHNPEEKVGKGHPIVVGQNLKFDQTYLLAEYDIELWPVFDTFRASSLIYNGKGKGIRGIGHNLYDLYARELGMKPIAEDLGGSNWGAPVLTQQQLDYAAEDVTFLPALRKVLRPKLEKLGLMKIAGIEFGAILPEASVELNGFPFDPDEWIKLTKLNKIEATRLGRILMGSLPNPSGQLLLPGASDWVFTEATLESWAAREVPSEDDEEGYEYVAFTPEEQKQFKKASKPKGKKDKSVFNLDSTDQMLESLKLLGGELAGLESTREMFLAMFKDDYPIIATVLQYREYATKMKSFGPDYLRYVSPVTGRIHSGYFPMLVTGRYASRNPNLSQIPRGKDYRKCFKAPPGKKFVLADYSAIEMRLAAKVSGDKVLTHLFKMDIDPHLHTASRMMGKDPKLVTKAERNMAKPCIAEGQLVLTNHGLKPIELVDSGDLLWDGLAWVSHGGVIYKGYREVMTHDGLTATPDHRVWLQSGGSLSLRDAASAVGDRRLAVGGDGEIPVRFVGLDREGRSLGQEERKVRRVSVLDLYESLPDLPVERPYGEDDGVSLSASGQVREGRAGGSLGGALRRHCAALYRSGERALQELRGAWDSTALRVAGALHPLDAGALAAPYVQGCADRPHEQHGALRAGEPAARYAERESAEQAYESLGGLLRHAGGLGGRVRPDHRGLPAVHARARDDHELRQLAQAEPDTRRGTPEGRRGRSGDHGPTFAHVYDIVDAGPRHRFVVSNRVVANCNFGFLYGMQAEKFVLYAMASYGVKFTPQQAKQFRDVFFEEYAGLASWHVRALADGKRTKLVSSPLGRIRYLDDKAHNEILNHPVQSAGADGLKKALRNVYRRSKKYGKDVMMVHHVHDEIISEVANEPGLLEVWQKEQKDGMEDGLRDVLYPIPVEADPGVGDSWADK